MNDFIKTNKILKEISLITFIALLLIGSQIHTYAQTARRVTTSGNASNDGSTWANAMTIQAALAASEDGDMIWIATGSYKAHPSDPNVRFEINNSIGFHGGFAGTETAFDPENNDTRPRNAGNVLTEVTLFLGDLMDNDEPHPNAGDPTGSFDASRRDNTRTIVVIDAADVVFSGVHIRDGNADRSTDRQGGGLFATESATNLTVADCQFRANDAARFGGGAAFSKNTILTNCRFSDNKSPIGGGAHFAEGGTITDCVFETNTALFKAGGLYVDGVVTLTDCQFVRNTTTTSIAPNGDGGGAYFMNEATLTDCMFSINSASKNGGGVYFATTATLTGCTIRDNRAASGAGGGFFLNPTELRTDADLVGVNFTMTNCIMINNVAGTSNSDHGGGGGGGSGYVNAAAVVLTNCLFAGSTSRGHGGGVYLHLATAPVLTNCTFYSNKTTGPRAHGGGFYAVASEAFALRNTLMINNTASGEGKAAYFSNPSDGGAITLDYNLLGAATGDIVFRTPGGSNITRTNDVALGAGNTATNVFVNTNAGLIAYLHLRTGSSAVDAGLNTHVPSGVTTDAAGGVRIKDGRVDLGAFELQMPTPITPPPTTNTVLGAESQEALVLYPNAVRDILHLSDTADILRLYDTGGRLLKTLTSVRSIDLRGQAQGQYVVEVFRGNHGTRFIIIKE